MYKDGFIKFQIINPLEVSDWNKLLLNSENYSFFHSSNWAEVLYHTYNYKISYFIINDINKFLFLLPAMEVNNLLFSKRGVCLPFSDYCYPIIDSSIEFSKVFKQIIDYSEKEGWKSIEIKGGYFPDILPSSTFYRHILSISSDENKIFKNIRENYRSKIKKALKCDLKVNFTNSFESVKEYYKLHCITRRNKGLPPQPFKFFENIYKYIIKKDIGFITMVSSKNKYIAGAMFFNFGKKGLYKFGASNNRYNNLLYANYLLFWNAIQWYCKNNFNELSFGRTNINNMGLLQFKDGWFTKRETLNYYHYNLVRNKFFSNDLKNSKEKKYFIFKILPISFLKTIGNLLYKKVG